MDGDETFNREIYRITREIIRDIIIFTLREFYQTEDSNFPVDFDKNKITREYYQRLKDLPENQVMAIGTYIKNVTKLTRDNTLPLDERVNIRRLIKLERQKLEKVISFEEAAKLLNFVN